MVFVLIWPEKKPTVWLLSGIEVKPHTCGEPAFGTGHEVPARKDSSFKNTESVMVFVLIWPEKKHGFQTVTRVWTN